MAGEEDKDEVDGTKATVLNANSAANLDTLSSGATIVSTNPSQANLRLPTPPMNKALEHKTPQP